MMKRVGFWIDFLNDYGDEDGSPSVELAIHLWRAEFIMAFLWHKKKKSQLESAGVDTSRIVDDRHDAFEVD